MAKYTKSSKRKTDNQTKAVDSETKKAEVLPEIIGGPPSSEHEEEVVDNLRANSLLVINIKPCLIKPTEGPSLFVLEPKWDEYTKKLEKVGFKPYPNTFKQIKIACQADGFPTDTFSNEYGEHFLNQITDAAGSGFGQFAQMMGKERFTEAAEQFGKVLGKVGNAVGGVTGSLIGGVGGGIESFGSGTKNALNNLKAEGKGSSADAKMLGSLAETVDKVLGGSRIDFPMIWKSSSYSATYSFTVRLYNPNPSSKLITKKYIVGPIAALLTLALPQSDDKNFYKWPFFCSVDCPGIFKIHSGAISNITITKGGDQGMIGFNQIMSMVDIRIDFVDLYGTMLLSETDLPGRPTLKEYLNNLENSLNIRSIYKKEDINNKDEDEPKENFAPPSQSNIVNNMEGDAPSRVNEEDKERSDSVTPPIGLE